MAREKFNVLLMRDDSNVKRFRLSPVWIKLGVYSLILLLVMAVGGLYVGYKFWKENAVLSAESKELQRQLRETNLHLERLQNVEKIIQSNDPDELQSLFGTLSVDNQKKKEEPKPPINLNKLLTRVNTNEVNVDNLAAKLVEPGLLRLTFDLTNIDSAKAVSGHVEIGLLTKDGQEVAANAKRADLVYQIQRYKKIVTSFKLPENVKESDLFALRIVVRDSSGTTIFSAPFEYEQILG
ncbi:MAG: hypothetical protein H0S85_17365 [Desulfovibrionaceae bacterium]|jgi:hypothetical protein|nr:hypothetical protein [Desulfovibrionaceae bacterium]